MTVRVATYNIHKCRGLDGRVRPDRIAQVLREIDADIVGLQEVWSRQDQRPEQNQAAWLARALGFTAHHGENRILKGGGYGNLLLSRFPVLAWRNHDITRNGREPRGCLRADIVVGGQTLHVFNVHLGTGFMERRYQADRLIGADIVNAAALPGTRIVLGDFNEWTRGLATQLLSAHLVGLQPSRARSYPGLLPLLRLDHIYCDPALAVERFAAHRSRTALIASDHLPLVADLRLPG